MQLPENNDSIWYPAQDVTISRGGMSIQTMLRLCLRYVYCEIIDIT